MRETAILPDDRPSVRSGPILVTGSHRSGSTWVGNALALAPGTGYVHEPFNTKTRPGLCNARFPTDLTYVTAENEAAYLPALRDTLAWRYAFGPEARSLRTPRDAARMLRDAAYFETMRRRGARVIMKDPLALFSAEWLAARFDMPVVVIIRHPAAFVASLIAAGWTKFRFRILLEQERLMADRLEPFRAEIAAAAAEQPEPLEVGILLWRLIHHHIRLLRRDHPDWIFVRHEDLSQAPVAAFGEVFARLGLAFTPDAAARINAMSESNGGLAALSIFGVRRRIVRNSRDNVGYFRKRLTEPQIEAIRSESRDVWEDFYAETDW
ncbi:MAG: sulfotransferase [Rhodobacteraceae bacterium]|nr:sulfotransferase [Paracoccaceae bacterium]